MKISPWAYLLIGVLVSIISFFMQLNLFVWIGIALAVFGGISLFILRAKPKKEDPKYAQYAICPYCAATIKRTDNFCWKCGKKLRNI